MWLGLVFVEVVRLRVLPFPPLQYQCPHPRLRAVTSPRIALKQELARNRQALYSERERRRKELREEEETKECTFRPKISRSRAAGWGMEEGARYGADGIEGGRPPLHERLHKEAREREAARALAHHHVEKEALRECTFQV